MAEVEASGGGEGQGTGRVMVALDESECSLYALEWALENLREAVAATGGGPPLIVFTAQPLANLSYIPAATYGSAPPELVRSLQEHQRKLSLALLERAKEVCAKHGVNAEAIMAVGDAKEAVCEAVEKHGVKLLVLGSHGKGTFQRAFLGSVSNYCVHHAKCAVLVVKK
ncbi:unnamed protein product [Spirodela intermedia]|uniref:UspA domain-containing protein n=2 Tax=Spirodela intermedia TaxID=51605 RepID=A0A7I8LGL7_SPIIN|nr:unnamed protein product [Spirodela intermedia]CAA6671312.1 unnamed protein product [Spirodela intermedia]CAA7408405.1 unnamed protein product [Spirodela intermedia]